MNRTVRYLCLLALSMGSLATGAQDILTPVKAAPRLETWTPPDLTALPNDWWTAFNSEQGEVARERLQMLMFSMDERSKGLSPEDRATAQTSITYLKSLFDLLAVARADTQAIQFEPLPAQEAYFLKDFLELRARRRELTNAKVRVSLEIDQTQSQFRLLQERRDNLTRQYDATEPESPQRILLGISRLSSRVEYELAVKQADNLRQRLKQLEEQGKLVDEKLAYARNHLDHTDQNLQSLQSIARDAHALSVEMSEKVAAVQPLLLEALSANPVNPVLKMLREQQIIRAGAAEQLARLQQAQAQANLNWYILRAGSLDADFNYQLAAAEAQRLSAEVLQQAELWTATAQAALIAAPPPGNLNTTKNIELAQAVARETLDIIRRIHSASDDLLVTHETLSSEFVASQSGLSKAWARTGLAFDKVWLRLVRLAEVDLFTIGDAPVTPAGLFKMLLILLLAFGASWLIRYLLGRGLSRDNIAQRAAMYTLGRLLHYIIIMVGIFTALGSIGIDFTSFALIAGALSVGIGFGLQAIVNNFVSGLILLFEGTLRVGDYIELDSGLRGVVREINTRATIINTNDSLDVVVPNSELVTTKLTNWTLRESVGRMRITFGVAYGSDKNEVKRVAMKAAEEVEFVLLHMPGREPMVRLIHFGDNALEFEMLLWVSRQGVRRPGRVKASFLWALETQLHENHIDIPFPQRDIHIRSDFRLPPDATEGSARSE